MEKTKFEINIDAQHFITLTVNDFDNRNVYGSQNVNVSIEMTKYEDGIYTAWVKVDGNLITRIANVKSYSISRIATK